MDVWTGMVGETWEACVWLCEEALPAAFFLLFTSCLGGCCVHGCSVDVGGQVLEVGGPLPPCGTELRPQKVPAWWGSCLEKQRNNTKTNRTTQLYYLRISYHRHWLAQSSAQSSTCHCLPGAGTEGMSHTHGLSQGLCISRSPAHLAVCLPSVNLFVPTLSSHQDSVPSLSPGLITCDTPLPASQRPGGALKSQLTAQGSSGHLPPVPRLRGAPASTSRELESKACATTPGLATSSYGVTQWAPGRGSLGGL